MDRILLASKSPRRREILLNAGYSIEMIEIDVEESYPADLKVNEVAEYLARKKSQALKTLPEGGVLLTADTIVILDDKILGKPEDKKDARRMLTALSGQKHIVITGVCLRDQSKMVSFSDQSEVYFSELTPSEIEHYINTPIPHDKAGSYGIQSDLGMVAVTKIVGSYFNIMGLPIHLVYQHLKVW